MANQARLMSALSQGNEALKQMQKAVTLDDVEKLTQDTADAREYQEQLQRVLGQASWSPEDEAATEADLAALEGQLAAEMAEEMPKVPEGVVQPAKKEKAEEELPSVPTHVPLAQGAKQAQRAEPIAAS